jgi:hypothetical protein
MQQLIKDYYNKTYTAGCKLRVANVVVWILLKAQLPLYFYSLAIFTKKGLKLKKSKGRYTGVFFNFLINLDLHYVSTKKTLSN